MTYNFALSQCACVWKDANGNVQCHLYSNCSGPNLSDCAGKVTNGTMCPCEVYPGMNWNCGGCQSNGACWYNGTACDADLVCTYVFLPVELLNFSGYKDEDGNVLEWSTASENNSSHFIVETSSDGISFNLLAEIPASGNSNQIIKYKAIHVDHPGGVNYYRLSQFDIDGKYEVYDPIAIDNTIIYGDLIRIVNVMGQEVSGDYSGIKIFQYSNGSTEKRY
jgi:hypothetical protein